MSIPSETVQYEAMGSTLLSRQPLTIREPKPKVDPVWQTTYNHLETSLTALRNWRYPKWAYWAVLARFFAPERYSWLVVANRMWRGSPVNDAIIDSTGLQAVRTAAGGMWTGLTSPSRPWFKYGIGLPWIVLDADGKAWLEDTEQRVATVLQQSNFYNIMAQAFRDVIKFATAPIIIYEDFEDVIRFYLPCAGEYFIAQGARLAVTKLYTEFAQTVEQIVEKFSLDRCPQQIRKLWEQGGGALSTEFVVCMAIEPNIPLGSRGGKGTKTVRIVPPSFTYREVYWLKGMKCDAPLSARGYDEQPFITLRWSTGQNDPYGNNCPCMEALGDCKQVQMETLRKAEYLEKGIRPPMGADVALKNEPASIMPAQITYMDTSGGKKGFWALFEVAAQWMAAITADIAAVNARLEKCLYVDLFMAISRMEGVQPRNELELTKRDLERLQELGPVIDLAEGELNILMHRVLRIMERRRMLLPKPKSLNGIPLKITYTSIMRLAQRSAESIAMKDTFATAGSLSSAAKAAGVPDPIRVINLDKAMRHYGDLNNFPADCVFTDDEVKAHDAIRAKAQQEAAAPGQAMAAVSAAKTLSETQVPGASSALGAILGQPGSGAPQ